MVELRDWAVISTTMRPWDPPELMGIKLNGIVKGHPRKEDGDRVTTSRVKKVEGRTIHTENNTYILVGEPATDYLEFLKEINYPYNPEAPIRVRSLAN